ncbi:hypothetical protein [Pectobacterium brasiliense]|uniref:hypothetical protein n=1 Tax=Pectobacterium brasiliense TaxID=180957 RepID=UPI0006508E4B|nr:hypothetical protein [Pectobacterium brasiliense]KMK81633.1 hypothetical protein KCO_19857 [Pectobacterium brasiliense ICMP 19477]
MTEYKYAKSMSQFYRDVFSRELELGDVGNLPQEFVAAIIEGNTDTLLINKKLFDYDSGLEASHDAALKQLLLTISLGNIAFDGKFEGKNVRLPVDYIANIRNSLVEIINIRPCVEYLVVAIQLLFRIGDVEAAVTLINNNFSVLSDSPAAFRILLMICMIEEDYSLALPLVQEMTAKQHLIGDHWFTLLMVTCAIYKLGGHPDSYIDFRPLLKANEFPSDDDYKWLIKQEESNGKVTVIISCDVKYYYEHAISALYSIYETNKDNFNVHFHVYNIDDATYSDVLKKKSTFPELNISCTTEYFSGMKGMNVHYASRRFIFARHALSVLNSPILILDADCLFRKNFSETIKLWHSSDLVLTESESAPFWEKALGGFVYLGGGLTSKIFIDKVASFIHSNLLNDNSVWFLDQVALSAAIDAIGMPGDISRIDSAIVYDVNHVGYSLLWMVTTVKNANGKYSDYKKSLIEKYNSI